MTTPRSAQTLFRRAGWLLPLLWAYLYITGPDLLEVLEIKTYDIRYRFMPPRPVPAGIVIVDIDARSVQEVGRFPWPRSKMAELIRKIDAHDPRAIALDIVFNDKDMEAQQAADILRSIPAQAQSDPGVNAALAALDHDRQLGEAISASGRVVGGYYFVRNRHEAELMSDAIKISKFAQLSASRLGLDAGIELNTLKLPTGYAAQANNDTIAEGMVGQGFFNAPEDRDGVIRALGHMIIADKQLYPSLAVETLNFIYGQGRPRAVIENGQVEGVKIGAQVFELDPWGRQFLRFYGPAHSFRYVSAVDVLRGDNAAASLKSAIVLVGSSAFIQKDLKHVPAEAGFPGIEIHATALANMLERVYMIRGGWWVALDLAVIAIGGLLLYAGLLRSTIFAVGFIVASALATVAIYTTLALMSGLVWLSFIYPIGAVLSVSAWAVGYKYYAEERQRRWIRGAFSQYLSAELVEDLAKHPERLALGGEQRETTILFSDIRDLSESLTPQQVVSVLNEYFEVMSQNVLSHNGFLDKYIGDAIFAVFGMVVATPNDAAAACRCALAMVANLPAINQRLSAAGYPVLAMNIGINSGPVVVGNLGSKAKFNYTVVGDAANVACRLEGIAKKYGVPIVISDESRVLAGDSLTFRELDCVQVQGRRAKISVYELVGYSHEVSQAERLKIERYHAALAEYRKKDWDKALTILATLVQDNDAPSKVMANRCREYIENPPSAEWCGVHQLDSK